MSELAAGAVFTVRYPFIWAKYEAPEGDTSMSWRPGIGHRWCGPEDTEAYANGVGQMVLTVVSVHRPGRFPTRVFYTRQFVTPDGKTFGRGKLHITTSQAFKRRARGFWHEFVIDEAETAAA